MRTYRLRAFGSPEGIAVGDEPKPTPGDGEVLIRIRASALNARDSIILSGSYPVPIQLGVIPLSDAAGEIEAVGSGVKRFKVGDLVTWNSEAGRVSGTIIKVHTDDVDYKGTPITRARMILNTKSKAPRPITSRCIKVRR